MLCCCGDTISVRQDIHEGTWWSSRCTPEREWSIEPFSGNMLEYFTILLTKKVVLWSEYCCFYIRPSPYDGMRKIIPRAREMHCYYLYYSSIVAKKEKFINFLTIIRLLHVPVLGKGSSYDLTDKQKKYLNRHLVTIVRCCCRWLFACTARAAQIYTSLGRILFLRHLKRVGLDRDDVGAIQWSDQMGHTAGWSATCFPKVIDTPGRALDSSVFHP